MFRTGKTPFDGKLIITYFLTLLGVALAMFILGVILLMFGVDVCVVKSMTNWLRPLAIVIALVVFFISAVKKILNDNRMI